MPLHLLNTRLFYFHFLMCFLGEGLAGGRERGRERLLHGGGWRKHRRSQRGERRRGQKAERRHLSIRRKRNLDLMVHGVLRHCHHRRLERVHVLMWGVRCLLHAISRIPKGRLWGRRGGHGSSGRGRDSSRCGSSRGGTGSSGSGGGGGGGGSGSGSSSSSSGGSRCLSPALVQAPSVLLRVLPPCAPWLIN